MTGPRSEAGLFAAARFDLDQASELAVLANCLGPIAD